MLDVSNSSHLREIFKHRLFNLRVPKEQEKQPLTQHHPIITYQGICIVNKSFHFSEISFPQHHKPRNKEDSTCLKCSSWNSAGGWMIYGYQLLCFQTIPKKLYLCYYITTIGINIKPTKANAINLSLIHRRLMSDNNAQLSNFDKKKSRPREVSFFKPTQSAVSFHFLHKKLYYRQI
jgi:hypothetical protein